MLPHAVLMAVMLAHPGAHANSMRARIACDTVASGDHGSGVIRTVVPGLNGRVLWTDATGIDGATSVWVRDGRGAIRSIGKAGGGPGEFRDASSAIWYGDTVVIGDPRLHRLQRFLASGALIDGRPLPSMTNYVPVPDGSLMGGEILPPPMPKLAKGQSRSLGNLDAMHYAILRAPVHTDRVDTIIDLAPVVDADAKALAVLTQRSRVTHSADGGFWCVMARTEIVGIQLSCANGAGTVTLRAVRPMAPVALTDAVWHAAINDAAISFGTTVAEVTEMFHRPARPASAYGLFVNRNGDIWLQRNYAAGGSVVWDRLSRDGRSLLSISLPPRHQIRALDGGYYYAADTDDDGLQTLIRCRIP